VRNSTGYGVYRVTGPRLYRGHERGTVFEAQLDLGAEQRAIARGDIELLERIIPDLVPGSYRLPAGWPDGPENATTEAPEGASLIS
jgi:hypothetical protein